MSENNDPPIYLEVCEHIHIRRHGNGTATLVRNHDLIDSAAADPAAELGTAPEPLTGAPGNDDTVITDRRLTADGHPVIATWIV